jgi:hypothetical protein
MRWSDRNDDDNLEALLRGSDDSRLGSALAELREKAPEAPAGLRERTRELASQEPRPAQRRRLFESLRISWAHLGAAGAAVLLIAVAIPVVGSLARTGGGSPEATGDAGSAGETPRSPVEEAYGGADDGREQSAQDSSGGGTDAPTAVGPQPSPPPPPAALKGAQPPVLSRANDASAGAAPVPSTTRAQNYSSEITLHVGGHEELSEAVQSAIRTTRALGGYVTYVDYGTSGSEDGEARLNVRVPVGRVQGAVARFSELGTILEQQTEIVDLQGRIDRITRDIQQRRDRIAKLEAELKDPTLSEAERDRLEARLVRAKRGLANAMRSRAGVLRQSRFAKLDLTFTTEKRSEPAAPPSELRQTLDDALGILAAELGVLLFVLIAGLPFVALGLIAWLGARALRRGSTQRVLERA